MIDFSFTDDELFRLETLDKINKYKINKYKINKDIINVMNGNDVLFIMDSNEEQWLFTKEKELFTRSKYNKEITEKDILSVIPELENANYENQQDFKAINLGLGHALLIRTYIYDEFMTILRKDIKYEDEFDQEQIYAAWNHWLDCAIKYIDSTK